MHSTMASDIKTKYEYLLRRMNMMNLGAHGYLILHIVDQSGNPIPGVIVMDTTTNLPIIRDYDGNAQETDDNGIAEGYVSTDIHNISVTGYADIEDQTLYDGPNRLEIKELTMTVTTRNFLKILVHNSVYKFSKNTSSVDVSCCGAGGSGAYGREDKYAYGGGGGGHTSKQTGIVPEYGVEYIAMVGDPSREDTSRLTTTFMGVSASGGSNGTSASVSSEIAKVLGGDGNGVGGYGKYMGSYGDGSEILVAGTDGAETIYKSFTEEEVCGGGGAGHVMVQSSTAGSYLYTRTGAGLPAGAKADNEYAINGLGGGGASGRTNGTGRKRTGGTGAVAIRMHLKNAL